jgi:hypothetical protein
MYHHILKDTAVHGVYYEHKHSFVIRIQSMIKLERPIKVYLTTLCISLLGDMMVTPSLLNHFMHDIIFACGSGHKVQGALPFDNNTCVCVTRVLRVYYVCITCVLRVCYAYITCVLRAYYVYITSALRVYYVCIIFVLCVYYVCIARVLRV